MLSTAKHFLPTAPPHRSSERPAVVGLHGSSLSADEFWSAVFGRRAPVEIEIGPGRGAFLLAAAAAAPDHDFFAIEYSATRAAALLQAARQQGLLNVRVLHADAWCVVASVIPDASVSAYHIYFPDPWWKRRHHRRRLFTPEFAAALARTLAGDGRVYVATDVAAYFAFIAELLGRELLRTEDTPLRPVVSQFEQKARLSGVDIHAACFQRAPAPARRRR